MPVIYNVTIEATPSEGRYCVTWKDEGNNKIASFEQNAAITHEDTRRLSRMAKFQLGIGQKLFHFLDGQAHVFRRALEEAHRKAEVRRLNLITQRQTHDWPFELLADKDFLLPHKLHLIRSVSGRRKEKTVPPQDRPLKLLFMATAARDVKPELDFEQEEEGIFNITANLPIQLEVEDTGTLEGLRNRLEHERFDVVHLSGHTGIAQNGRPYFIMEDETGNPHQVLPYQLWNEALVENPPRLLFLSGSRIAKARGVMDNVQIESFARQMSRTYNIPSVLGWGKPVRDALAIHAGKMIYHDLSRGKSVLQAVMRARFDLHKRNASDAASEPAWPQLRLYGGNTTADPYVTENQKRRPKPGRIEHVYLKNSRVMVLAEGFVGRRRQIQTGLKALKKDEEKIGTLILGAGGLGKSCLAGKLCERFNDHTLIIVHGKLNALTLETALQDAFIKAQDHNGLQILAQKETMKNKLSAQCATGFREKNYLILLDDFEQNQEGAENGQPGAVRPEAADLLEVMLTNLPDGNKKTQLIITGRYGFSLQPQGKDQDLVKKHLQNIWLTGFRQAEKNKKARALKNISNYSDPLQVPRLLAAGRGNPRLMEWLDHLVGQMEKAEIKTLLVAVRAKQEEFVRQHLIRELLQREGNNFELFLRRFCIYRQPVLKEGVRQVAKKFGTSNWDTLLQKGMEISLIEHDGARGSYQVTPMLREELTKKLENPSNNHEAAFNYYKIVCRDKGSVESIISQTDFWQKVMKAVVSNGREIQYADFDKVETVRDALEPELVEEWIYHALGCGQERVATMQAILLIFHLQEQLALQESLRIGLWTLEKKKRECTLTEDAFLLNGIAYTYKTFGNYSKVVEYSKKALLLFQRHFGKTHPVVSISLNSLGQGYSALGRHREAEECFQQMMNINREPKGENDRLTATSLNCMGTTCDERGDHAGAIRYYLQALDIWKQKFGDRHPDLISPLTNLGSSHYSLGKYSLALQNFEQALSIARQYYDENHPLISNLLNHQAGTWVEMGNHKKAVESLELALAIEHKLGMDRSPEAADKLNTLGFIYNTQGDYANAIKHYEQALAIYEKAYGPKHPKVATTKSNLGKAWTGAGNLKKAVHYLEQAQTVNSEVYGEDHQGSAATLNNLGSAFYKIGDYPKAIDYSERALAIVEKTKGPKHLDTATARNNLGEIYRASGKRQKAIEYFKAALTLDETPDGGHFLHVATTHINLGAAYFDGADYAAAEKQYQRGLDISRKMYGDNHPQVAAALNGLEMTRQALTRTGKTADNSKQSIPNPNITNETRDPRELNNLGTAAFDRADYPAAIDYFQRALAILRKKREKNHPDIATALNNLASAWRLSGQPDKAIDAFQQVLAILKTTLGEKHPHVAMTLNNLGTTYHDRGNYREALDNFEQALTISRETHGEKHPVVGAALNNIGSIRLAIGEPEGAIDYCKRALDIDIGTYGETHPEVAGKLNNIGAIYYKLGQIEKAKDYFERSREIYMKTVGPEHPNTKNVCNSLNACL
jgi:tetratricopeptide (TPR) repeat protein